ncbi:MAG TPA: RNA polymerase sigma factor [Longimicrobium sp.]|nr:RNA polymerase sigma factor [Longimicrobium sp.]
MPAGAAAYPPENRLIELSRRARGGDRDAMDQLLRHLQEPVQRFLVRRLSGLRDRADVARDLGQEVLIRANRALSGCTFPDDGRLMAWVLIIARHVLADYLRAERGRCEVVPPEGLEAATQHAALARWHSDRWSEPRRPLVQVLAAAAAAELPEDTRELVRLRVQLGYTWKQAAAVLQISESAAKRRFQRARATVRRRLLARLATLSPLQRERALRALGQPPGPAPAAPAVPWRTS